MHRVLAQTPEMDLGHAKVVELEVRGLIFYANINIEQLLSSIRIFLSLGSRPWLI